MASSMLEKNNLLRLGVGRGLLLGLGRLVGRVLGGLVGRVHGGLVGSVRRAGLVAIGHTGSVVVLGNRVFLIVDLAGIEEVEKVLPSVLGGLTPTAISEHP